MKMMKIYNTLTRKKENFKPIKDKKVGLYTCGPTVYNYAHIGNLRTYIFEDVLRRTLEHNGYEVKQVMNITDVGHLTSDSDTGEDKMEVGAKREGKTAWKIANFYALAFKKDLKRLNIRNPHVWCRATRHIKEQIELIKDLEKNGFTYQIKDGVYFNTAKLKDYGKLVGRKNLTGLKAGARIEIVPGKRNPTDFALWKLTLKGVKRQMEWVSPWGKGFPGWHIECSAMSMKYLGKTFDIHCGGIEHIPIHHTNEIAQSEAATGKKFVNYWLEGEHLLVEGRKMAKSLGNFYTLDALIKKGFDPLAFRYLVLTSHYRSKLNFTWKSLEAGQNALNNLYDFLRQPISQQPKTKDAVGIKTYEAKFKAAVSDDLNTPKAVSLVWQIIKDNTLSPKVKKQLLFKFDTVLGLDLNKIKPFKTPTKIKGLAARREIFRANKQFIQADTLRKKIEALGYVVEDTPQGPRVLRK